jgi:hypothetical protein
LLYFFVAGISSVFVSSRKLHTILINVIGIQTCALPIL